MKNYNIFLLFLIINIFFVSCQSKKYFSRNRPFYLIADTIQNNPTQYLLQPDDYLYISIQSPNQSINEFYQNISNKTTTDNSANLFLNGYMINDSGYIFITTIGYLYLKDKTISEAKTLIDSAIRSNISDAIVNVRLASFSITFVGEFNQTGKIQFYQNKLNILEAVGYAGGVSEYGNLRKVYVYRIKNNQTIVYKIDLTNKDLIRQPYFYLFPGDILYAPPSYQKNLYSFIRDYSTFISIFTTTISTTILIIQLLSKK